MKALRPGPFMREAYRLIFQNAITYYWNLRSGIGTPQNSAK